MHFNKQVSSSTIPFKFFTGIEKRSYFAQYLIKAEKDQRQSVSNGRFPRTKLFEAFAQADIYLVKNDAQDIWDEIAATFKLELKVSDILSWLMVDLPSIDEIPENLSPTQQKIRVNTKLSSPLGSFQQSTDDLALREMIQSILKNKVHLAYVFRTYGSGSGIISGTDLCHALRQPPFNVVLSDKSLWKFICQIVTMDPAAPSSSVFLRYNEVVKYLEAEYGKLIPPASFTIQSSLRKKLEKSRYIQGIPDRVLGHLQILRTRLRNIQQRGATTSWEGIPDMCSIREFISLLQSIDLNITTEEADHLWAESRKNRTENSTWNFLTGSHDDGMKAISIGSALVYLDSLLRSSA